MAKKVVTPETAAKENKPKVEIVVSTFFPTRIIKSITIQDLNSDRSFRDQVTLDRSQAKYLYEQLSILYGEQKASEL